MAQATKERQTRDGSIGRKVFDAVEKLVAGGKTKKQAFEQVARREGKSVSAVQSAYYATARRLRAGRDGRRRHDEPVPIDRLTEDLVGCIQELGDLVRAQQAEIEGLQDRIQSLRMLF
jgi:hypothetical protein